jgi:hypothetical protein
MVRAIGKFGCATTACPTGMRCGGAIEFQRGSEKVFWRDLLASDLVEGLRLGASRPPRGALFSRRLQSGGRNRITPMKKLLAALALPMVATMASPQAAPISGPTDFSWNIAAFDDIHMNIQRAMRPDLNKRFNDGDARAALISAALTADAKFWVNEVQLASYAAECGVLNGDVFSRIENTAYDYGDAGDLYDYDVRIKLYPLIEQADKNGHDAKVSFGCDCWTAPEGAAKIIAMSKVMGK